MRGQEESSRKAVVLNEAPCLPFAGSDAYGDQVVMVIEADGLGTAVGGGCLVFWDRGQGDDPKLRGTTNCVRLSAAPLYAPAKDLMQVSDKL
jgi:hypothetical protein